MKKGTIHGRIKGSTWYGGGISVIVMLLLSLTSFGQLRDSIIIDKGIYKVVYSETLEQPLLVSWKVQCTTKSVDRAGMDFKSEPGVHTSRGIDYLHNDYDKGHNMPAADADCDYDKLLQTFNYLNCSLQNQYLNRGTWKTLEEYERDLATKYPDVEVEVRSHFSAYSKKLITGATVPDGFTKTIRYGGMTEKFYFKNERPQYPDYKKYRVN